MHLSHSSGARHTSQHESQAAVPVEAVPILSTHAGDRDLVLSEILVQMLPAPDCDRGSGAITGHEEAAWPFARGGFVVPVCSDW